MIEACWLHCVDRKTELSLCTMARYSLRAATRNLTPLARLSRSV
jgi:hypothetical protein